ncbi:TPA: serine/threonine-protein phosphatase [Escherichia coli]|nr:serine/threonine-protein phosphatase [Escherichia coli]
MISILSSSVFSCPRNESRENQDSVLHPTQIDGGFIMAVADGVGGYKGGKEASEAVVKHLSGMGSLVLAEDLTKTFTELKSAVASLSERDSSLASAATTLTLCIVDDSGLTIGHAGDCRVYLKYDGKLRQVTKDHTQHQMLIDNGMFTARELKKAKGKNVITTAVSANIKLTEQVFNIPKEDLPLSNGVLSLFIMSDGAHSFWELRPRFSINTLSNSSRFANSLKNRIESKGPVDDYSLLAVNVKFS